MGFFKQIFKATIDTAMLPLDLIKDSVTLGGSVVGEPCAMVSRVEKISTDLKKAYESLDDEE